VLTAKEIIFGSHSEKTKKLFTSMLLKTLDYQISIGDFFLQTDHPNQFKISGQNKDCLIESISLKKMNFKIDFEITSQDLIEFDREKVSSDVKIYWKEIIELGSLKINLFNEKRTLTSNEKEDKIKPKIIFSGQGSKYFRFNEWNRLKISINCPLYKIDDLKLEFTYLTYIDVKCLKKRRFCAASKNIAQLEILYRVRRTMLRSEQLIKSRFVQMAIVKTNDFKKDEIIARNIARDRYSLQLSSKKIRSEVEIVPGNRLLFTVFFEDWRTMQRCSNLILKQMDGKHQGKIVKVMTINKILSLKKCQSLSFTLAQPPNERHLKQIYCICLTDRNNSILHVEFKNILAQVFYCDSQTVRLLALSRLRWIDLTIESSLENIFEIELGNKSSGNHNDIVKYTEKKISNEENIIFKYRKSFHICKDSKEQLEISFTSPKELNFLGELKLEL
ncbi:MAG: hypothetical protein MHPSP_000395, partial [Paramarteilia canceri]